MGKARFDELTGHYMTWAKARSAVDSDEVGKLDKKNIGLLRRTVKGVGTKDSPLRYRTFVFPVDCDNLGAIEESGPTSESSDDGFEDRQVGRELTPLTGFNSEYRLSFPIKILKPPRSAFAELANREWPSHKRSGCNPTTTVDDFTLARVRGVPHMISRVLE